MLLMNRTQKIAWWMVAWIGAGIISAGIAVGVSCAVVGFPKAWSGLGLLGISGLSGLAPLVFRKDPGPVQFDERDQAIQLHATMAGFAASYGVFGALAMGIWFYCGPDKLISVNTLPQIWMGAFVTAFFVQSLATLVLYGRDNKTKEGGAA
jgi:hypothetical protein